MNTTTNETAQTDGQATPHVSELWQAVRGPGCGGSWSSSDAPEGGGGPDPAVHPDPGGGAGLPGVLPASGSSRPEEPLDPDCGSEEARRAREAGPEGGAALD